MTKFKVGDIVKPKAEKALWTFGAHLAKILELEVLRTRGDFMDVRLKKATGEGKKYEQHIFEFVRQDNYNLVSRKQELHVTSDGTTTHAVLKEGGKVVKRARADCDPRDEFDFETGARLAIDRVFGKEEEKKEPEYKFNIGDYVVVKDKNEAFPYFKDFVKRYDKDTQLLFAYGHCPKKGDHYTVITRGLHPETKAPLYLIQPSSNTLAFGELYLIGERGLALLEDCCKYL